MVSTELTLPKHGCGWGRLLMPPWLAEAAVSDLLRCRWSENSLVGGPCLLFAGWDQCREETKSPFASWAFYRVHLRGGLCWEALAKQEQRSEISSAPRSRIGLEVRCRLELTTAESSCSPASTANSPGLPRLPQAAAALITACVAGQPALLHHVRPATASPLAWWRRCLGH